MFSLPPLNNACVTRRQYTSNIRKMHEFAANRISQTSTVLVRHLLQYDMSSLKRKITTTEHASKANSRSFVRLSGFAQSTEIKRELVRRQTSSHIAKTFSTPYSGYFQQNALARSQGNYINNLVMN